MTFVIPFSGSAGVRDLIPCKTLLETSVKPPSFLQHVMISMLVNKFRVKSFMGDRHTDKDTGTGFSRQPSGRHRFRIIQQTGQATFTGENGRCGESRKEFHLGSLLVKWHHGDIL